MYTDKNEWEYALARFCLKMRVFLKNKGKRSEK